MGGERSTNIGELSFEVRAPARRDKSQQADTTHVLINYIVKFSNQEYLFSGGARHRSCVREPFLNENGVCGRGEIKNVETESLFVILKMLNLNLTITVCLIASYFFMKHRINRVDISRFKHPR